MISVALFAVCFSTVLSETLICPPLPFSSLPNGQVISTGFQKFRFLCDDGFMLGGPTQVRCHNGSWSSNEKPECWQTEDRCEALPSIPNGDLFGGERNLIGSVVQYVCHEGYTLIGNNRRSCLSNGYWSGITPACMGDAEPLQFIAERLDKAFVKEMGSYAKNDSVQSRRYLDTASIKNGLELIVLIDRSSSVDPYDLEIAKDFLKFLFDEFNVCNGVNENGARVAVIAFGSEVDVLINVDDEKINSSEAASQALEELLKPGGGGTAMVTAMATIHIRVKPILRDRAKKAMFLITDGEPNIGNEGATPEDMAYDLKEYLAFEIFSMGIGADINRKMLASVASEPVSSHVFFLKDYGDLSAMMAIIRNRPTEAPPVSSEKCGHVPDKNNNWPWMAAIYVSVPGNFEENETVESQSKLKLCGGALICSNWVLTAASCFYDVYRRSISLEVEESFVVLGEYNLLKVDKNQENFYASDVIMHPDFDPMNTLYNNLALVKLDKSADLDTHRTICLPPTDRIIPMHLDPSLNVTIAGWGKSASGKFGDEITPSAIRFDMTTKDITLVGNRECRGFVDARLPTGRSIFCAEAAVPDQCTGNTGSPLVTKDPKTGVYHVIGILSERKRCDLGQGDFAQLTDYVKWINNVTSKCHFSHWNS